MKTIKDIDIKNKIVLVRVDYNVPLKNKKVENNLHVRASLPTINYLLEHDAKKIVLISHLGRPEGKENPEFSLKPVAETLQKLLKTEKVGFYPLDSKSLDSFNERIILLENLRFDPGEEENSPEFIKDIIDSTKADLYIQDGFAVIHRAHASTDAVKKFLPVYAGLLLEKEVENLKKAIEKPEKPVLVIIGGSKIEDKAPLIEKFLPIADKIIVGGKIAADGYKPKSEKIYVAEDFDEDASGAKLDVGPLSTAKIAEAINDSNTIIWNGLLGKAEDSAFATSSIITAEVLGSKSDATTIICGGDTTGFIENLVETHKKLSYSLVSTGGGAALEFLLGKELPGLKAIKD